MTQNNVNLGTVINRPLNRSFQLILLLTQGDIKSLRSELFCQKASTVYCVYF